MAAIADIERFLERVFERTSARLFHSRMQAVQVERHVERAMEAGRRGHGASTRVPSHYRVRLHPADLEDLAVRGSDPHALATRLADRVLAFARLHGYHLAARPTVSVAADPSLEVGHVVVDLQEASSQADRHRTGAVLTAHGPAQPTGASEPPGRSAVAGAGASEVDRDAVTWAPSPAADRPAPLGQPPQAASAIRSGGDRPYSARPVAPPPARALLRVNEPGRREREVRVEGGPLTLGRASDNGLVIVDARVSRHHGRFLTRHGTLVYTDLGSLNGTRVNGIRVDEIVLGPGDRLQVGDAVVVVERLPD